MTPELILADEPTGKLDSENGHAVVGLVEELNREGRTVVMVTHNPQVAAAARREVTLHDGRIVRDLRRVEAPVQSIHVELY